MCAKETHNIWPNYNISPTLIFLKSGDFPSLATFWGEVVSGRCNLSLGPHCPCVAMRNSHDSTANGSKQLTSSGCTWNPRMAWKSATAEDQAEIEPAGPNQRIHEEPKKHPSQGWAVSICKFARSRSHKVSVMYATCREPPRIGRAVQ